MRSRALAIGALVAVGLGALLLRAAGLHAFPIGDETHLVYLALFLDVTGQDLPAEFAMWPTFAHTLVRAAFRLGILLGLHGSPTDVGVEFVRAWATGQSVLHVEVRMPALLCGMATLALTWALARRWFDGTTAFLAAAIAATAPLAVLYSRLALTDAPHALACAAALWCALRYATGGSRRWFLASCASAGVAFATKYLGGMTLLAAVAALFLRSPPVRRPWRELLLGCLVLALAAFAACPSLVLAPGTYLEWLRRHAAESAGDWPGFEGEPAGLVFHLTRTLPWALGSPALCVLAGLGLVIGLVERRRETLVLLAFVAPFYLLIGLRRVLFARYLLPLLPVVSVLAAAALTRGLALVLRGRWQHSLVAVLAGLVVLLPVAARELDRARVLRLTDTRILAADWITAHVPKGTRLVTANGYYTPGFDTLPLFAYPPIDPTRYAWEYLLEPGETRLRVDFATAREGGGVYLWSSFLDGVLEARAAHYPELMAFARGLGQCELLASFAPGGAPSTTIHPLELCNLGVTGAWCERPGPTIRVYRLR